MTVEGIKMRHVLFSKLGGPEVLETLPFALPQLAPDEVRVKISAIGLNRFDALFRRDHYVVSPEFPSAMGSEAVGVVTDVGANVHDYAIGERVTILPRVSPIVGTGTYATHADVPTSALVRSIDRTSDTEEAALWMASLQAYNMLTKHPVKAGDIVLLTAATSAVGTALVQIARDFGATVIATSRRSNRTEQLLTLGANHVIATDEEDLTDRVRVITDGRGASLACDTVGGRLLEKVVLSVAEGGHILSYGAQTSPDIKAARVDVQLVALDRRTLTFVDLFELTDVPDRFAAAKAYFRDAVARGALKPVIDRVFPFDEIVEAHRHLEVGSLFGKVVVTVG
ncbi:zinc-dependent alcohol dehydrogenase family protein [Nitratireductor sp. L1-7-SE]|uniref:Zinc-dependent alcohol dehydrogenase family protein n=1 Tax=Nitratireductor rhodophyticola TaxID=2854036 RepID=A0ABS7RAN3_9HYPH|nr:zinc-dependent alcohol dehydrogenase family protein [Nitratireductor rhodophyticola]MBY8917983.1 zinc-dependent alcohol dehydrogenase family protein [Nitratireductor rhodophyticola]MBY8921208.1 zinc-dependent alcohol dehydrogenase family protein [Nitratireductor rhodophyticola]